MLGRSRCDWPGGGTFEALARKSAKDGAYSFKDLSPSSYRVYCENQASQTKAVVDATVKAGETSAVPLDLVR